jgi:mRNA interferase YafQ
VNYDLRFSNKAKKDLKRYRKNKRALEALGNIVDLLAENGYQAIPETNRPHKLSGNYEGCWECHALPDLLVIWEQYEDFKEVVLIRVGSHSELF